MRGRTQVYRGRSLSIDWFGGVLPAPTFERVVMKPFLIAVLLFTSGFAVLLFFILWWERGFDGAWATFERFAEDVLR